MENPVLNTPGLRISMHTNAGICKLVLACAAWASMGAVALAQTIAPGSYVYEGGNGTLMIKSDQTFSISTFGGNAHMCELEGTIRGNRGAVADSKCGVTLKPAGANWQLDTTDDSCRDFCGARAGFQGLYIKPSAACTYSAVAKSRKVFKSQYDQKDYTAAIQTLAPVLTQCAQVVNRFEEHWIRNDVALAQFKAGDKAGCLATLAPLAELASRTDADIRDTGEPTYVENYLKLAKAVRTNLRLCKSTP